MKDSEICYCGHPDTPCHQKGDSKEEGWRSCNNCACKYFIAKPIRDYNERNRRCKGYPFCTHQECVGKAPQPPQESEHDRDWCAANVGEKIHEGSGCTCKCHKKQDQ
jgi:hypothetical protein